MAAADDDDIDNDNCDDENGDDDNDNIGVDDNNVYVDNDAHGKNNIELSVYIYFIVRPFSCVCSSFLFSNCIVLVLLIWQCGWLYYVWSLF